MKTNLKLTHLTLDQMLNREEKSYNETAWKQKVNMYAKFTDCQFYVVEKDSKRSYSSFFASYKLPEGLKLFSEFSGYSSCLSDSGFYKVEISEDGTVYKTMFTDDTGHEFTAKNCKENRKMFVKMGCMVSSASI